MGKGGHTSVLSSLYKDEDEAAAASLVSSHGCISTSDGSTPVIIQALYNSTRRCYKLLIFSQLVDETQST